MHIYNAHNGRSFHLQGRFSLDAIALATQIPSDSLICMAVDGTQLTDEAIEKIVEREEQQQHAAGGSTNGSKLSSALVSAANELSHRLWADLLVQEFFVFNRDYLSSDPEVVAEELREPAALDPPIESKHIWRSSKPISYDKRPLISLLHRL